MYNVRERYVGRALGIYGEYSPGEAELYRQILKTGDTVVEIGSHIGSLTIPMARFVGETGRVLAFEPQRLIFQLLAGNVALNSLTNVYTYNKAAGRENGKITIPDPLEFVPDINTGAFELIEAERGVEIDIIRLDDLGLSDCALLKIDCEGMEQDVLAGGMAFIESCRPIIYMEENQKALGILQKCAYRVYEHEVPLFSPANYFGNQKNVFFEKGKNREGLPAEGNVMSFNWLCLPADSPIQVNLNRKI